MDFAGDSLGSRLATAVNLIASGCDGGSDTFIFAEWDSVSRTPTTGIRTWDVNMDNPIRTWFTNSGGDHESRPRGARRFRGTPLKAGVPVPLHGAMNPLPERSCRRQRPSSVGAWRTRRGRSAILVALSLALGACVEPPAPEPPRSVERLPLNAFEGPFGYSQAVKVERRLYVSGTMPVDREGRLVAPGDLGTQLDAVYANLALTLAPHGAGFDRIVMERIYVTDMDAFLAVADRRFRYHPQTALPATTIVQVERLIDPGFLIAIDAVVELPALPPGRPPTR